MKKLIFFLLILSLIISCRSKRNYVTYYKKVYEADSILRFKSDTLLALKKYRKIFRKYEPKNNENIKEFETFITLSDQFGKNFGGKKNIYKLIILNAHNWNNKKNDQQFMNILYKYGLSENEIYQQVANWKKGLNPILIDSFKVALKRDQDGRPRDLILVKKNVNKNARFLKWTLDNYGFPSMDKIGWFPRPTFLSHMIESDHYQYFKVKIPEYIKNGDCDPRDYAMLVDYGLQLIDNKDYTFYGVNGGKILDSAQVNKNRKSIGLPSLKHKALIRKQLSKKNRHFR